MKKRFLATFALVSLLLANASADAYTAKMRATISQLDTCRLEAQFQACANTFERIGMAETGKWLPQYYAAYAYVLMSYTIEDNIRKDKVLDKAQELINAAMVRQPDESELYVLQAFLYPSRILVNPMERGLVYMEKIQKALQQAKTLNADNPRIYYLEAIMLHNSPPAMGGGADKALPLYQMAMEKYKGEERHSDLAPAWGDQATRQALSQYSQSESQEPGN